MTITIDNPRRIQFVATAGQTVFPYNFKIFAQEDLEVFQNGLLLVLITDYTVSGVGVQTGGNVTLVTPATLNDDLVINSDIQDTQTTDYSVGGEFTGLSIETALDKLTVSIQEFNTLLKKRGLTYVVTDILGAGDFTIPKLSDEEFWKFSGGGIKAAKADPSSDTLRSELASQTSPSPGSDLVGTFNTRTTVGETLKTYLDTYTLPINDSFSIIRNTATPTKQLRIDVSAVSAATTRVISMHDADVDLQPATGAQVEVGTNDVNYMTSKSLTDGTSAQLQVQVNIDSTGKETTATIPFDTTIPQQTEGFELLTLAITPKRADTKLLIEWKFCVKYVTGTEGISCLFRDATADAISCATFTEASAELGTVSGFFIADSVSTAATTFKLRTGSRTSQTLLINRLTAAGAPAFGGTTQTILRITEYIA